MGRVGKGGGLKFTEFKLVLSFRSGNYSNSKPNACFQIGLNSDSRKRSKQPTSFYQGRNIYYLTKYQFLTFWSGFVKIRPTSIFV